MKIKHLCGSHIVCMSNGRILRDRAVARASHTIYGLRECFKRKCLWHMAHLSFLELDVGCNQPGVCGTGICMPGIDGHSCDCSMTGYIGAACDECKLDQKNIYIYMCVCVSGFSSEKSWVRSVGIIILFYRNILYGNSTFHYIFYHYSAYLTIFCLQFAIK